jgi:hypothetical protein
VDSDDESYGLDGRIGTAPNAFVLGMSSRSRRDSFLRRNRYTVKTDHRAALGIEDRQSAVRFERLAKESCEYFGLVPVAVGVLFPNQRVARDREQLLEISLKKRPQCDQRAAQMRL